MKYINLVCQFAGPDGNSLFCGCGWAGYVEPQDEKVACLNCGRKFDWNPRPVSCASPYHNENCSNPDCWKYVNPDYGADKV